MIEWHYISLFLFIIVMALLREKEKQERKHDERIAIYSTVLEYYRNQFEYLRSAFNKGRNDAKTKKIIEKCNLEYTECLEAMKKQFPQNAILVEELLGKNKK